MCVRANTSDDLQRVSLYITFNWPFKPSLSVHHAAPGINEVAFASNHKLEKKRLSACLENLHHSKLTVNIISQPWSCMSARPCPHTTRITKPIINRFQHYSVAPLALITPYGAPKLLRTDSLSVISLYQNPENVGEHAP